jgi:N-acylglucosamine-6-phosphate 2-epimerase
VNELCPPRSIVVSCQPGAGSPLRGAEAMALLAQAAVAGGAAAIRANGVPDVTAIRKAVDVPILGINKVGDPRGVFITPSVGSAAEVVAAGADMIAMDGTLRPRPDGRSLRDHVREIKSVLRVPIMADVDSLEAGLGAREAGADVVATTLAGYTDGNGSGPSGASRDSLTARVPPEPDVELVARLCAELDCPVIAEGRYWTPDDVEAAFDAGAHAVVIGTAVTNPMAITRRFVSAVAG